MRYGGGGQWHAQSKGECKMILAKTTNLDIGAQSEEFILCAECYNKLDDAIAHANAETGTDIAICEVTEGVDGTCEQCGRNSD